MDLTKNVSPLMANAAPNAVPGAVEWELREGARECHEDPSGKTDKRTLKAKDPFEQPACEFHKDGKVHCIDKPSGGESCAFDGAYIVLNPIRDALHVVHGGITCGAHNYESRGALSSGSQLYRVGISTDLSELDIINGATEKLRTILLENIQRFSPAAVFVYITCIPAMIGEETERVCLDVERTTGTPVIPVGAPGFLGHKNLGNRLAGEVLLKVIGTKPVIRHRAPSINIIGEYNISGDLWNILPVFEKLGIAVNCVMTGDEDYDNICRAHGADVNMLVCSRALINLAVGMKQKYNIDYFEASFFGLANSFNAYQKTLLSIYKNPNLAKRCKMSLDEALEKLQEEVEHTRKLLSPYRKKLAGKKAVIYSGGVKSWSLISCLQDLGIETAAVGTKKASASDLDKIEKLAGPDKMFSDTSPKNTMRLIRETNADFFIAGSRNQYLAYKERIPYIDVNQERVADYGGFIGLVQLARDLCKTLESPVWQIARESAPW